MLRAMNLYRFLASTARQIWAEMWCDHDWRGDPYEKDCTKCKGIWTPWK